MTHVPTARVTIHIVVLIWCHEFQHLCVFPSIAEEAWISASLCFPLRLSYPPEKDLPVSCPEGKDLAGSVLEAQWESELEVFVFSVHILNESSQCSVRYLHFNCARVPAVCSLPFSRNKLKVFCQDGGRIVTWLVFWERFLTCFSSTFNPTSRTNSWHVVSFPVYCHFPIASIGYWFPRRLNQLPLLSALQLSVCCNCLLLRSFYPCNLFF